MACIREKKVHVYGMPDVSRKPVQIFLDIEGNEDGSQEMGGSLENVPRRGFAHPPARRLEETAPHLAAAPP
jgi:hypothetical protein